MSDAEQQLEELEVLASIFPDEFRTLDSVLPVPTQWAEQAFGNTFKIELKPSDYETKEWHGKKASAPADFGGSHYFCSYLQ